MLGHPDDTLEPTERRLSRGSVHCAQRSRACRKDKSFAHTRAVTMLEVVKQISNLLWPYLFSRQPDSVERDDTVRR